MPAPAIPASGSQATYQNAIQIASDGAADPPARLRACAFLVLGGFYENYPHAREALDAIRERGVSEPLWLICRGIVAATGVGEDALALECLRSVVTRVKAPTVAYHAMVWVLLRQRAYSRAVACCDECLRLYPEDGHARGLRKLAELLGRGVGHIQIGPPETGYRFKIFTSNSQEIEAALFHINGQLTESAELAMVARRVGPVDRIAEIGCLVGNHSVFFLRHLRPKHMTVIDASQTSLDHTRVNLEANQPTDRPPATMRFVHSALGGAAGRMGIGGQTVRVDTLGPLLEDKPVDFLKIDIDGMEMEALRGARGYLARHRPIILIEVLDRLEHEFRDFARILGYRIDQSCPHRSYANHLLFPV